MCEYQTTEIQTMLKLELKVVQNSDSSDFRHSGSWNYSERPITGRPVWQTGRKYVRILAYPAIGCPVDNNLLQSVRLSDRLNAPGRPITGQYCPVIGHFGPIQNQTTKLSQRSRFRFKIDLNSIYSRCPKTGRPVWRTGRKNVRFSACPVIGRPVVINLYQSVRLSDRLNAPGRPITGQYCPDFECPN